MFIDKVKITIKAGDGGRGAVSFLRNKQTSMGGPDGGDGGKGGNIIFRASNDLNTLYGFKFKKKFVAKNGSDGGKTRKTGSDGADVLIEVPCGTILYDAETNKVFADLQNDGELFTALKGGLGGKGNEFYKTSTRQAPRFSQSGEVAKEREVVLELKTLADVGLVGYPNVGKSTLLSVISNARPKIANYAFTTLTPNLGVVQYHDNSFVVADIPGLIEGASEGVGLGHYFLKHIERVRLILHLIDISESEGRNAVEDFKIINKELAHYSEKLSHLNQIIILTKCDLIDEKELTEKIDNFTKEIKKISKNYPCFKEKTDILPISSISNKNLEKLKDLVWSYLEKIPKTQNVEIEEQEFDKKDKTSIEIVKSDNGSFTVSGGYVDQLIRGIVLSDYNSFSYFQLRLKRDGIIDKLKEKGLKNGDTVKIKDISFDYVE